MQTKSGQTPTGIYLRSLNRFAGPVLAPSGKTAIDYIGASARAMTTKRLTSYDVAESGYTIMMLTDFMDRTYVFSRTTP